MKIKQTTKSITLATLTLAMVVNITAWSSLLGQDASTREITLPQAVERVVSENPDVQVALQQAAITKEDQSKALSMLLPQVSAELGDSVKRLNVESSFGSRGGLFPQHEGPYQVLSTGISFHVPLLNTSLFEHYRAQQANHAAAVADTRSVRAQLINLTVTQYLLCIRSDATVKATESQMRLAKRLFDQAANLEEAGVGTSLDTLRSQQKLRVQQQALIVAREEAATSLYGLVRLLNLPPATHLVLSDESTFTSRKLPQPEEASLQAAYVDRPEMVALRKRLEAANSELSSTRAEHIPHLDIQGSWLEQGNSPTNAIPVYQYQAVLSVPVFTGGRIRAEVASSSVKIKLLQSQEQELKNQIAFEVKTAATKLRAALDEVKVADDGLALAQEEVAQAQDRFQAGVADNVEVVTAQDTLSRAYEDQIAALYRANQSRADLERAMGRNDDLSL